MSDSGGAAAHVPWWQKNKYQYHKHDPVSLRKIRPGMKLKRMNCSHPGDALTWESYRQMRRVVWWDESVRCPICRTVIPDEPDPGY